MIFKFKEVSRKYPCEFCRGSSWCARSICEAIAICRRCQHDNAKMKIDKNGDGYYVYALQGVSRD